MKIKKTQKKALISAIISILLAVVLIITGHIDIEEVIQAFTEQLASEGIEIPDGPYIIVNDNIPEFDFENLPTGSFETYSELDFLGRVGVAYANLGQDLMPTEERESISHIRPTGYQVSEYDFISGDYLYNRCHLIGFQLSGENANEKNLLTGTRYLNTEGMLPFENMIADYIKETNNHVLYRVTPEYDGLNLLASGVKLEAYSIEDKGAGISFNVYCPNIQPNVEIDYRTGDNRLKE